MDLLIQATYIRWYEGRREFGDSGSGRGGGALQDYEGFLVGLFGVVAGSARDSGLSNLGVLPEVSKEKYQRISMIFP